MRPIRVQPFLLMSTEDHRNDSVISYTSDNQKEEGQENVDDEDIFLTDHI